MNKNYKVPVAVLSCFLIAFVLQGVLKLCGVFVFEKALDWDIFKIIDSKLWLQIIYYSIIVASTSYCLSFSLTTKPYSKKWYHYLIIIIPAIIVTTFRLLYIIPYNYDILLDILLYVIIPFVICITSGDENRLLTKNLINIVLLISFQASIYFCYLGLTYWSSLLNSIVIINTIDLPASTQFLIFFELYLGLVSFMLSMNILITKIKERIMIRPVNIASDKAKLEAKIKRFEKVLDKKDKEREIISKTIDDLKAELVKLDENNK